MPTAVLAEELSRIEMNYQINTGIYNSGLELHGGIPEIHRRKSQEAVKLCMSLCDSPLKQNAELIVGKHEDGKTKNSCWTGQPVTI